MTDHLTDASVKELLDGATPGPWRADGEPWNRVVWSSAENRVCFMAHSNGLNDERDIATSNLAAAAPDLARMYLAARADTEAAVALALEELRHCIRESYQCGCMDAGCAGRHAERNSALEALSETLDALAPASGVAKLEALRAERDAWRENHRIVSQSRAAMRAERDTLAAEVARLRDRERVLEDFVADFASAKIDALRYQPAYGESPEDEPDPVVEAETVWAWQADAKAALSAAQPAGMAGKGE